MSAEEKITAAFAVKNWQVEEYDYDRHDGYAVSINTEEYPEIDALGLPAPAMLTAAQERLIAAYSKAFGQVERAMQGQDCTCDGGCILADSFAKVLRVAELIPDRLSISA